MAGLLAPPALCAETPTPTPTPDHGPGGTPRSDNSGGPEGGPARRTATPELKDWLKTLIDKTPGDEAWFKAAHAVVAHFLLPKDGQPVDTEGAVNFSKDIVNGTGAADTAEQLQFDAVVKALNEPIDSLKALANDPKNQTPEALAARFELKRRADQPMAKLMAKFFSRRPEKAISDAADWAAAVTSGDNEQMATVATKLLGLINKKQREALSKELTNFNSPDLAKKAGYAYPEIEKMLEAVAVSLHPEPAKFGGNDFQKAFAIKYQDKLERNANFHAMIGQARAGDGKAKEWLEANYKKEDLLDFLGGQIKSGNDGVGVAVSELLATKRGEGTYLTLAPTSPVLTGKGDTTPVELYLGKEPSEIRAALEAFYQSSADVHGSGLYKTDTNAFDLFTVAPPQGDAPPKRWYAAAAKDGKVVLKENKNPQGARPDGVDGAVASKKIAVEAPIPPPRAEAQTPPAGTPPAGETPPAGTPPAQPEDKPADPTQTLNAGQVNILVGNACQNCHTRGTDPVASGTNILKGGQPLDPKDFMERLAKGEFPKKMLDALAGPTTEQLKKWANTK